MPANEKGARAERELVNALDERGFEVIRSPASGSGTQREQPDLLAGDGAHFYLIEAKSSSGDPIYLQQEEVDALQKFAHGFGGYPLVGARFDEVYGDPTYGEDALPWYFFHPERLHRTPQGNYRVKKETALAEGETLDDL